MFDASQPVDHSWPWKLLGLLPECTSTIVYEEAAVIRLDDERWLIKADSIAVDNMGEQL